MRRLLPHLPRVCFLLVMLAGSLAITASSLGSLDDENLPAFVIEKLPVRFEALWLGALRVHVLAAMVSLPACLLLMTKGLQRRLLVHRWLGRVTGVVVLSLLVPSGVVLAFEAKGGAPVTAGFLLSGGLIAWFMVRGVVAARRHLVHAHRRATWHVVAQMSVAVTSRAMLLGLEAAAVEPERAYVIALWVPVVLSGLIVEALSWAAPERNHREDRSPVAAPALAPPFARVGR
ncbi:MAG: DUF2306 domain-containing protein [Myxococcus sp.]|nr:DUF2306 domain-containing protein [Myxococcus sp.]